MRSRGRQQSSPTRRVGLQGNLTALNDFVGRLSDPARLLLGRLIKRPQPAHLRTGLWGEKQAEKLLKRKGLRIIGRRIRVGRRDELDLVARDGNTLVFIEVKTRKTEDFGRPITSIKSAKHQTLSRAAARYLKRLKQKPDYFRFDVVEVIGEEGVGPPEIRHIPNAFQLHPRYHMRW